MMPASISPVPRFSAVLLASLILAWVGATLVLHLLALSLFTLGGSDRLIMEAALALSGPAVFALEIALCRHFKQRAASQKERLTEARFLAVSNCSQDALFVLEAWRGPSHKVEDFVFRFLNDRAMQLLGNSAGPLLGGQLCRHFPVFRENGLFESCLQALESGKTTVSEIAVRDENVHAAWLRCSVTQCEDAIAVSAADLTEQKSLEARLIQAVLHDALTGLPNRTLLDDRLRQLIERSRRHRHSAAVLLLHIDRLGQINSRYGHEAGDHVLKTIAQRLLKTVRATDSVFRLSSDQFVVLLGDLPTSEPAIDFERKLLAIVSPAVRWHQFAIAVSVSIGTAIYPAAGSSPETLLVQADLAVNRARRERSGDRMVAARSRQYDLSAFQLNIS